MDAVAPIIVAALGGILLFIGVQLYKNGKLQLINNFLYANVKDSDKQNYTKEVGLSILVAGTVLIACAVIMLFGQSRIVQNISTIVLILGILAFLFLFLKAEFKYNRKHDDNKAGPHL